MKNSFKKSLLLCATTVQFALVLEAMSASDAFCALASTTHRQMQDNSLLQVITDKTEITAFNPALNIDDLRVLIDGTTAHVNAYLQAHFNGNQTALLQQWTDAVAATNPLIANNAPRPTEAQLQGVIGTGLHWDAIHNGPNVPKPLKDLAQAIEIALYHIAQASHT